MVKRLIEGSNDDEILQFCYPQRDNETTNPMKLESNDLNLRSRINPSFKINKNPNQIWAKMKSKMTKMTKLTT